MALGNSVASALARARALAGVTFTWNGNIIHASQETADLTTVADVAQGAGINVANADVRILRATPTDFPGGVYCQEQDTILLNQGGGQTKYTIGKQAVPSMGGVDTAVQIVVYRTPQPLTALNAPAGETGAGLPIDYQLPANEH